jgi:hypothetical protein
MIIGKVAAAGNSFAKTDYSFTDAFPQAGINYYRLKMTDLDQHYKYSSVVALKKSENNIAINNVYPNPFINEIEVSVISNKEQNIRLNLINYEGKLLTWKEQKCKAGTNTILFKNLEKFTRGTYLLQFIAEDGIMNKKMVKVN